MDALDELVRRVQRQDLAVDMKGDLGTPDREDVDGAVEFSHQHVFRH